MLPPVDLLTVKAFNKFIISNSSGKIYGAMFFKVLRVGLVFEYRIINLFLM